MVLADALRPAILFEFSVLVVSLIISIRMVLGRRTINDLPFQLFLFFLVWTGAEVPRVLWDLGLLEISYYINYGFYFHTLSMTLFALFMFYRFLPFLGVWRFQTVLQESIREGLSQVLGKSGAKAVNVYVDASLALKDLGKYLNDLREMFGEGYAIIEGHIAKAFCDKLRLEYTQGTSLVEYVEKSRSSPRAETKG